MTNLIDQVTTYSSWLELGHECERTLSLICEEDYVLIYLLQYNKNVRKIGLDSPD